MRSVKHQPVVGEIFRKRVGIYIYTTITTILFTQFGDYRITLYKVIIKGTI